MKIRKLLARLGFAAVLLSTLNFQLSTARAQGTAFTYQGVFSQDGTPANGSNDLTFTLFNAPSGGGTVGTSNVVSDLLMTNGLFTVTLDFGAGVFDGNARWLQIAARPGASVGAYTNLLPRQPVSATPYALFAGGASASTLVGAIPSASLAGTYAQAVTLNNAGNLFAGNGSNLTALNASQLTSGTVPAAALSNAWKLGGNTGANPTNGIFLGTTDNQPLEFKVNNQRGLRLEYANAPGHGDLVNVIGGYSGNSVAGGVGATISGGGALALVNQVLADFGTVGGGVRNTASGPAATVGGGSHNTAVGDYATVPGGFDNIASGLYSFAAGFRAKASHPGAFVWADIQLEDFESTADNQFLIRAAGGVAIGTNDPAGAALRVAGSIKADSYLGMGGTLMLGTTDNQPLEFKVNNQRGLRLEHAGFADKSINVIGGYSGNSVGAGVVGATIAGGGMTNISGFAFPNTVTDNYGTVGGGRGNTASGSATVSGGFANNAEGIYTTVGGGAGNVAGHNYATVGGGTGNIASNYSATIGGGEGNFASGDYATIPGGYQNVATNRAFAAGFRAKANHPGAFVWADNQSAEFASTGTNQFLIRASGGARFVTGGTGLNLDSDSVVFSGSAQTARFGNVGGAAGFDFNTGDSASSSGVLIEQGLNESSGIFFDGDSITLWCPGDNAGNGNRLLRILDEDLMGPAGAPAAERFYVDGNGGFGSAGNGTVAGSLFVGGALTVSLPNGTVNFVNDQFTPALVMAGGPAPGILRVRNALEIWPNSGGTSAGKIDVRDTSGAVQFVADGSTGNVGIGTASPGATLFVRKSNANGLIRNSIFKVETQFGAGGSSPIFEIYNEPGFAIGALTLAGGNAYKLGGGSWSVESDARLKKNVADLHGSLDRLLRLRSVSFEYKDPAKGVGSGPQIGFIAQEVREVLPHWVTEGSDGMLAVSVTGFESLTVDALRELRAEKDQQIGELKAENAALKQRLEKLEQLVAQKLNGGSR